MAASPSSRVAWIFIMENNVRVRYQPETKNKILIHKLMWQGEMHDYVPYPTLRFPTRMVWGGVEYFEDGLWWSGVFLWTQQSSVVYVIM